MSWLIENSPFQKFTVRVDERVNWEARDRELATQICQRRPTHQKIKVCPP